MLAKGIRSKALCPFSFYLPIHNDRNLGVREHPLRFASDQQASQSTASVRRHEDHVTFVAFGNIDDSDIRRRFDTCHRIAGNTGGGSRRFNRGQMLARFFFRALVKIARRSTATSAKGE